MLYLLVFFLELAALFFLAKKLTGFLYRFFYKVTKNQDWSIYLLAILFLPGTFIHEISHFLAALFFLVPVGDLELLPQIQGKGVKLGSVSIGKTDPIRRFLVGVAPFIIGTSIILVGIYFLTSNNLLSNPFYILLSTYFIFAIANTMFASPKDLEGALQLLIFLLFIYALILITGISFPFLRSELIFTREVINVLKMSNFLLMVPLAIDLLAVFILKLVNK